METDNMPERKSFRELWSMNLTLYLFILIKDTLRKNKYRK